MKVNIRQCIQLLMGQEDKKIYVVNLETGRFLELESVVFDKNRYLELPSDYEFMEYQIMEAFIDTLEEGSQKRSLTAIIRRIRAFRRFKELVEEYGLMGRWEEFREKEYNRIAVEWCEQHGLVWAEESEQTLIRWH